MAFASRTKFYWSRFFATCVKYLGVANTQHIRYITEKIFPTEMSRQNILYHVRIAEEKGWLATFSSSLEMTDENQVLFRSKFLKENNEKISAQRFVILGTESFDPEAEERIIEICKAGKLEPISIFKREILETVTGESIKRLGSIKDKSIGNRSLFMVLLRYGWLWLNINPNISLKIISAIKANEGKHDYNTNYKIDARLLEIVSLLELETTPELTIEDLKDLLDAIIKLSDPRKRSDLMNLMSMTLLISGRFLISYNKLPIAEEYLNRGIKYLRLSKRSSILMRKLHVDGLFDLGFIYSQQGWFYKALGIYENIERILAEEFTSNEPIDNLYGRLSLAKSELYLMLAWPAYTAQDDDYRSLLMKALNNSQRALKYYQITKNHFKVTEINLFMAWILALHGKVKRAELLLKRGTKELQAPVPPKLNALYYNAIAELYRKQGKLDAAIKNITLAYDYLKIVGHTIGRFFSMTRMAAMHVQLSAADKKFSYISYGDMSSIFEKGISDMISHVFLEFNKKLAEKHALVSFFIREDVTINHPEISAYVEFLESYNISPALLGESFTIVPENMINMDYLEKNKVTCIVGNSRPGEEIEDFRLDNFAEEFAKFDELFQKLLSKV
ncbi:MAG: hypothetical protein ACTSP7_00900 [Candidatus Heimdallarchaeota archaeon]